MLTINNSMDKKTIISLLLLVAGVLGLLLWGGSTASRGGDNALVSSELVTATALYDFGRISMKDGNVRTRFSVTNPTSRDITLKSIVTSCMCTEAFIVNGDLKRGPFGMPGHGGVVPKANEIIKAGETREIEVVYDPNAHGPAGVGPIGRFIYLIEEDEKTLELQIRAVVTP
ncbi:hypothetical protein A3D62_00640 [Candidatus Kaiserbacteria bacterium RIFCSPHIGHO2_02_FULL_49_11]|uniref:DUF1573 domain-containing protein n=1 Tax=Candidatus Kaiserbacteria bacterium RIFCSPHIGHO2_02_FULL_49_11 TaxID=1798489 RepID=A0A1F6D0N8_9BACT|nr:MAG: hypothetical protein A3D62_00640 [Candidatus Kaiserbacteria bacterium RIFCSPHIGHO2_02_FULL_49_11]